MKRGLADRLKRRRFVENAVPTSKCRCGKALDRASSTTFSGAPPEEGDLTVCILVRRSDA
jgi:hypothetical protein